MSTETDGQNMRTYNQDVTRRFRLEDELSTKLRLFRCPSSRLTYEYLNTQYFDAQFYNYIFRCLETLTFLGTDVSAHKKFSDVPDEQIFQKYKSTLNKAIHRDTDTFDSLLKAININNLAYGHFPM